MQHATCITSGFDAMTQMVTRIVSLQAALLIALMARRQKAARAKRGGLAAQVHLMPSRLHGVASRRLGYKQRWIGAIFHTSHWPALHAGHASATASSSSSAGDIDLAPAPYMLQVQDTLRYTAFLGAFAGVYVAVDEGLAALFGNKRCVDAV
jgi:enoyl-CoA hydratase/carnithine racemase